ncbi:DUF4231 domain-containing protein [Microbacterium sp. NPDC055665]
MTTEESKPARTPVQECETIIASVKEKADKNKFRARFLVWSMTISTAAIPVVIIASGEDAFWGKVVPAALAAASALLVAINNLERPHERWVLYRRYHRLFAAEAKNYRFRVKPYAGINRDRRLGERIANLEIDLQAEWEGLIPKRSEISSAGTVK